MTIPIYCAAAISGRSFDEVTSYYKKTRDYLDSLGNEKRRYDVWFPFLGKSYLRNEIAFKAEGYNHPLSTNHAIIERDRWMVRNAKMVYLNLVGAKTVSIGCMMELAWAHDHGIHTVVVLDKDNIHRHAFVLEAADVLFDTEEEAFNYFKVVLENEI
jgi:hypothetical protein